MVGWTDLYDAMDFRDEALKLHRLLSDGSLRIVSRGQKEVQGSRLSITMKLPPPTGTAKERGNSVKNAIAICR